MPKKGYKLTDEHKRKIGLSCKNKHRTQESIEKYKKIRIGKSYEEIYGIEKAKKIKEKLKGRKILWKDKISKTLKEKYKKGLIIQPNKNKTKENYEPFKKISKKLKGRKILWKDKISKTLKEKYKSGEIIPPMLYKQHSEEIRKKISIGNKGKFSHRKGLSMKNEYGEEKAKELINKRVKTFKTNNHTSWSKNLTKENTEFLKYQSERMLKNNPSKRLEVRYKISIANKGRKHSEETKKKISENLKKLWKNEEYRKKVITNSLKGLMKRPTSFEQKISALCFKYNLPFIYKGNGDFLINFKNPDFVNFKDKIVIEVFYSWFKIRDYGSIENYKEFCRKKYNSLGWKVIFIDELDLNNNNWEEKCLNKIQENFEKCEIFIK